VQRLDHWQPFPLGCVVRGWGNGGKRVMKVDDAGPLLADQPPEFRARRPVPDRAGRPRQSALPHQRLVRDGVAGDSVPMRFQQPGLGGEHLVLTAGTQILVVAEENAGETLAVRASRSSLTRSGGGGYCQRMSHCRPRAPPGEASLSTRSMQFPFSLFGSNGDTKRKSFTNVRYGHRGQSGA